MGMYNSKNSAGRQFQTNMLVSRTQVIRQLVKIVEVIVLKKKMGLKLLCFQAKYPIFEFEVPC